MNMSLTLIIFSYQYQLIKQNGSRNPDSNVSRNAVTRADVSYREDNGRTFQVANDQYIVSPSLPSDRTTPDP
jgi:hypothetical protein